MDAVAPLAGQVVQILTPFLPYLLKAGEDLGARAAQQMEDTGWDLASRLWGRLGAQVDARPSAREAATDLAAQPTDDDAQAALRVQIKKLLADEPQLQHELEALLNTAQGSGSTTTVTASGDRSVAIGHDVRGSTIITGDQTGKRSG
ncbi:MAG TPA: hypothetical protein VKV73_06935 [Chloroflexota bacterium]|nr:hypothetical protein [Chloroflexota bacterium]